MHTLYDSETFCVNHMMGSFEDEASLENIRIPSEADADKQLLESAQAEQTETQERPTLIRHGFEIVDKRSGKEVYLDGSWAELFQQHILDWQRQTPTQEEVEDTLEKYAELAQTPVSIH